jgi:prevent-host-death family protein
MDMDTFIGTTIGAYEAKTHLSALLDRAERGESLTITRNGRPVARLVPAEPARPTAAEAARIVEGFRQLREKLRVQGVRVTQADIRDWIEEGRR